MKNPFLIPSVRTKCKSDKICSSCGQLITVGTKYTNVIYNDAFIKKLYGIFHNECWDKLV